MSSSGSHASLSGIARELSTLRAGLAELEGRMRTSIDRVPPDHRESARNLVHYVALRQHDLRDLQRELWERGLSSLGRSESCVQGSLLEVSLRAAESLALRGDAKAQRSLGRLEKERSEAMSAEAAERYLHQHTHDVLGPRPDDRHIYVMVTAPPAREADRAWMVKLLQAGMNVLRINCAHETRHEWQSLVTALEEARDETGRECRVMMDLAGPKIRTGPISGGRRVATWKPVKNDIGEVVAPARVVARSSSAADPSAAAGVGEGDASLVLDSALFASLQKGDELRFADARKKKRRLVVAEKSATEIVFSATRRAYLLEKAPVKAFRGGNSSGGAEPLGHGILQVTGLADSFLDVRVGDPLLLSARPLPGRAEVRDHSGRAKQPGIITCTLPSALDHLEAGQRVLFDDGKIESVVERARDKKHRFLLRVTRTAKETVKLRAEKGINLPDTDIDVSSLTKEDETALTFAARHADAIGLSFARRPEDIRDLHARLGRLKRPGIAVVIKIETRMGFENLPRMLLEGLRRPPLGVLIGRGDLAVEVGFERLAELQEEILWLCEACHVPSIWATQVLDSLARTGIPSRAEVTDAAASVAAECVMLNKGPFVDEAVRVLADILRRMEKHHYKKRNLFRKLRVSTFLEK